LKKARAPLAYQAMRVIGIFLFASLLIVDLAHGQVTDIPTGQTQGLPLYRPVLLGKGPDALINRIDTQDVVKKGQKDAILMFVCSVRKTGQIEWSAVYRGTPNSDALREELQKKLSLASDPKFIPAVYNHRPVDAIYYGTLTFAVVDNRPRLRIFSNQEIEEVNAEHDFVGPQPFFGPESKFTGFHYPSKKDVPVEVDGVVELKLKIDSGGNLQELKVDSEEPPFLEFGSAAVADFGGAKFIPAFRDGKPTACDVTLRVYYKSGGF
jgi:hypothetical protein